ncbi:Carbohydrate binding module (family 6) [Lutibacter agarilyticus]|uniref:Carbohydrate binding module (Family 6) n=1 Tax=Lutibacter agarilyticus TaxID=1109740 RepID=A0A238Z3T3_9FLAO|nr:family 43 glycosylhydrolase [Lutibacter agarilyticus]SNR77892.1 Carbohydrate binding module (family 6) [Lutibacter agarilyticus]
MKTDKALQNTFIPIVFLVLSLFSVNLFSQNPLVMDQFTADPTVRVFDGKLYMYPSHDVPCKDGQGFIGFCMPDYHVFSSENLTEWEDHGVILSHNTVPWVEPASFRMWAPDCVFKNGKYYYYFPANSVEKINGKGRRIGVAVSDKPYGPFAPEANFIEGIWGIDPNVFTDKDGKSYIYWAEERVIYGALLKENMVELASVPVPMKINGIGRRKFIEGPFMFERKGIYYMTFPYIPETTEQIVYATSDNPLGPFKYQNVIMKEWENKCYTNHQSIVAYKNQWYLFYHHNELSPDFDKNRSIKADSLFFDKNGLIKEIIPSKRGIGVSNAEKTIQIDRYSRVSKKGVSTEFNNSNQTFDGWNVSFNETNSWLQYNKVEFSNNKTKTLNLKVKSPKGGSFEVRLNAIDGPLVAIVNLEDVDGWKTTSIKTKKIKSGIYNLFIVSKSKEPFAIDWLQFEQ